MATLCAAVNARHDNYQILSLDRAVRLLDCFTDEQPELGVSEISRKLGMHKATVHRVLTALGQHGLTEQDRTTEKYRLGLRLLELGARVNRRLDLTAIARPELEQLVQETAETAHLLVADRGLGLYLEKVESPRAFRMPSQVGRRLPLHCSGVGKAILAFLPEAEVEEIVNSHGLERLTPHTLTSVRALKRELKAVQNRGYAIDNEEIEVGLRCVGAPVFDAAGRVVAGISIAGPAARMTDPLLPTLAKRVVAHANAISIRLGHRP